MATHIFFGCSVASKGDEREDSMEVKPLTEDPVLVRTFFCMSGTVGFYF